MGAIFVQLLRTSPLLMRLTAEAAAFLSAAVSAILRNDLQRALNEIFRLTEDEIPDEYAEAFLTLAQNVCASVEYPDGYIFFKKKWIAYLIEQARRDEAAAELDEFEELMPNDAELRKFRSKL
jgi:hypothetical protein